MSKLFCSSCGTQIDDTVSFCPSCGNRITINSTPQQSEKVAVSSLHNPYTKFIFIIMAIQIVLLIISGRPGAVGGYAFISALVLVAAVLAISILSIVKSKKYNHKGKVIGIVFTCLSSLVILVVAIALIVVGMDDSVETNENKYINDCINTVAINSVGTLKDSLKDPSSLKINKIYAKVYDTRITAQFSDGSYYDGGDFKGYFEIYIDYTANNGLGGVNREIVYYKYNQDLVRTNSKELDNMPTVSDDVWVLDSAKYNELAESMIIN